LKADPVGGITGENTREGFDLRAGGFPIVWGGEGEVSFEGVFGVAYGKKGGVCRARCVIKVD